jgi:hypothetical protein
MKYTYRGRMLYALSQLSKLKNVHYKSEEKNIFIKEWDIIMYLLIFETLVSKNSKIFPQH